MLCLPSYSKQPRLPGTHKACTHPHVTQSHTVRAWDLLPCEAVAALLGSHVAAQRLVDGARVVAATNPPPFVVGQRAAGRHSTASVAARYAWVKLNKLLPTLWLPLSGHPARWACGLPGLALAPALPVCQGGSGQASPGGTS